MLYFFLLFVIYHVPVVVIMGRISKTDSKYFNGQLQIYLLSWFISAILYGPAHKVWIFEKFVFELRIFPYDFKIDCIMVW